MVSEKIGSKVGQKEIFRFASRKEVYELLRFRFPDRFMVPFLGKFASHFSCMDHKWNKTLYEHIR